MHAGIKKRSLNLPSRRLFEIMVEWLKQDKEYNVCGYQRGNRETFVLLVDDS